MPSLFDKLFEGKRRITAEEYLKQTAVIKEIVENHGKKLDHLQAKVSAPKGGLTDIERNVFLKSIDYIKNILDGVKPKALTVKEVQSLNKSSKSTLDKAEQAFYQSIKQQDKKLNSFNKLYKELDQKIDEKIKPEKIKENPVLPLMAFDKERKKTIEHNKEEILNRLKAKGARHTLINPTRPNRH